MPTVVEIDGKNVEFPDSMNQEDISRAIGSVRQQVQSSPASFGQRAAAGLKLTPEGRLNYLKATFGEGNAFALPDGTLGFRRSEGEPFQPFDPRGLDLGDIADLSGGALESVPGIAAGFATGNPALVGAVDAGGALLRQGAAALVPGEDPAGLANRAGRVAVAGGAGYGAQRFANTLGARAVEATNPKNLFISRQAQRRLNTPRADANRQLATDLGLPDGFFTPGQESGDATLLGIEAIARKHPLSDSIVGDMDERQIQVVAGKLYRKMQAISDDTSKDVIGASVRDTFKGAVDDAVDLRARQAGRDFKVLDRLTGNEPILELGNYRAALEDIVASGAEIEGTLTPAAQAAAKKLQELGERNVATGRQFQNSLSAFTRAARGTGNVFKDLDTANERRISRVLRDALVDDLDVAARGVDDAGDLATAIKTARENYKLNSEAIDGLQKSAIGRILGRRVDDMSGEQIAKSLYRLRPSEVASVRGFLEGSDPELWQRVKRGAVQDLLDRSPASASQSAPADLSVDADALGELPFSLTKFVSKMKNPEEASRLRAMLTPGEFKGIQQAAQAMHLVMYRAATEGSPTARLQMLLNFAKTVGSGATSPSGLVGTLGAVFTSRRIAQAMTTPEGRRALIHFSKAGPVSKTTIQALGTLTALWGAEEARESARRKQDIDRQVMESNPNPLAGF